MTGFNEYLAGDGTVGDIAVGEVNDLVERCEWFSLARIVREHLSGNADPVLRFVMAGRGVSSLKMVPVDISKIVNCQGEVATATTDEIIDKFLQAGDYRIVADSDVASDEESVCTEAEFADEDDLVSEELAEIYLSQGLKSEALAIYRKLSLLNTEKSVYFAEIIDKIENNN